MSADMGAFRVDVEIENPVRPGERRRLRSVLVDTGAELSWFPKEVLESLGIEPRKVWHFRQADGTVLARSTGLASVYLADIWTGDEVVFGEAGDLVLLGSRSLEGLNLKVDPVSKRLIDAGPAPAAVAVGRGGREEAVDKRRLRKRRLRKRRLGCRPVHQDAPFSIRKPSPTLIPSRLAL